MIQVFVSHTKNDKEFCDDFDLACSREGIKSFRSEFEEIPPPPWKVIKDAINNSVALFFLVGKELVKNQDAKSFGWEHTQNWIAYEIGLACQQGIDVWAICDDVLINFPMPYINNYCTVSLKHPQAFKYIRDVFKNYIAGRNFAYPYVNQYGYVLSACCPCGMEFNLHVSLKRGELIKCPQCFQDMAFKNGHPPKK